MAWQFNILEKKTIQYDRTLTWFLEGLKIIFTGRVAISLSWLDSSSKHVSVHLIVYYVFTTDCMNKSNQQTKKILLFQCVFNIIF